MSDFDVSGGDTPQTPETLPSRPPWLLLAVVLLVAWMFWSGRNPQPQPNPDDQTIIIDDDQPPKPDVISIDGGWLVFVLEKTSPTADQSEVLTDGAFFDSLKSKGMIGHRTYDDEQIEAKPLIDWAVGRGLAPPLVFVVKDKQPKKAVAFINRDSVTGLIE